MKTIVKIPRLIFERAQVDLRRPHQFASERVGFFSTRRTVTLSTVLVHCVDYHPVADEHYIRDNSVGVRIGPKAITTAMSRATAGNFGQIHVHSHGGQGLPSPSPTDYRELPAVVEGLENANADAVHGWMVLSGDDAWTALSLGKGNILYESPLTVVGFPTRTMRRFPPAPPKPKWNWLAGLWHDAKEDERYCRQSFLGKDSDRIIAETVIGIAGLSGGGSHSAQQLAHLGFRRFVLCDADRISESNLNRLVGATRADVRRKRLKTEIMERNIKKLHRDADVVVRSCKWEETTDDLIGCDLMMSSVDSFSGRRDLEGFCRRNLIPMIDVGMDVEEVAGKFEINGQVILSMPGHACMHCMGFLNEKVLGLEAQKYGAAGGRPQVVWSNGILASAAVGAAVDLVTDWSRRSRDAILMRFIGSELSLAQDNRIPFPSGHVCRHFPLDQAGDAQLRPL